MMESKFEVGLPSGKLNCPPKSCIPSKANMKMKRKRSSKSDKMEEIAFIKATTKLRNDVQYLGGGEIIIRFTGLLILLMTRPSSEPTLMVNIAISLIHFSLVFTLC